MTLIELSVILVIAGLMIVIAVAVVPVLTERTRLDTTSDVTIDTVRQALVSFAATNARLPCADTSVSPNGLEGSGVTSACAAAPADVVGRVPYRVLGLPDPVLDEAHLPVRYAVYRNQNGGVAVDSSVNADLAALTNRFIPVLPGNPATLDFPVNAGVLEADDCVASQNNCLSGGISEGLNPNRKMPDNQNDLDFCLALRNAKAAAASTSFVHTLDLGGATPSFNAAFVLASGGVEDADGDLLDLAFDGINEIAPSSVDFESPARRRGQVYDDLVFAMPFDLLESKLQCAAITIGVNAAANVANAAAQMVVQTEDILWQAERNTVMDDIAKTQAELALALAILQEIQIIADGIRAGINATCPSTASDAAAIGPIVAAGIAGVGAIVLAGIALDLANQQLTLNDAVLAQALLEAVTTNGIAARICLDATNVDQRGGQGNAPPTPASPPDRP